MPDCVALDLMKFSINWSYVSWELVKLQATNATGIREVTEVRPGECLEVCNGEVSTELYWDARKIAASDVIDDQEDAIRQVRTTTKACVRTWAARHDAILHYLSGGIDSSIVLACLQDWPDRPEITCVNNYSPGATGDERAFARMAADHARCELIEQARKSTVDLSQTMRAQVSERPQRYSARLKVRGTETELARARGASAIFSGDGGDEVFLTSTGHTATDYFQRHGIDATLFNIVLHRAQIEGISVWRALREAVHRGLWVKQLDFLHSYREYYPLLSDELIVALGEERNPAAPWYSPDIRIPPGKQHHIVKLLTPGSCYLPFDEEGDPEQVSPLLSQPLIELCLRIPTYVLTSEGWDRIVARRASREKRRRRSWRAASREAWTSTRWTC